MVSHVSFCSFCSQSSYSLQLVDSSYSPASHSPRALPSPRLDPSLAPASLVLLRASERASVRKQTARYASLPVQPAGQRASHDYIIRSKGGLHFPLLSPPSFPLFRNRQRFIGTQVGAMTSLLLSRSWRTNPGGLEGGSPTSHLTARIDHPLDVEIASVTSGRTRQPSGSFVLIAWRSKFYLQSMNGDHVELREQPVV